ncbi:hypothetical protein J31TS3_32560 [Paenibacillus lactis]|nr:hypothetical protein J31TS3_32560 [Paenibacillus lactis]
MADISFARADRHLRISAISQLPFPNHELNNPVRRNAWRREGMRDAQINKSVNPYIWLLCPRFKDIIGETARLMNATIRCELMKGIRRGTDAGH